MTIQPRYLGDDLNITDNLVLPNTPRLIMCGYCEYPVAYHIDEQRNNREFNKPCERDALDWSTIPDYDYEVTVTDVIGHTRKLVTIPTSDYSGNEAGITTLLTNARDWEWDCMYEDQSRLVSYAINRGSLVSDDSYDYWRDVESTACTTALQGYNYSDKEVALLNTMTSFSKPYDSASNLATDERRNAYVEGFAGYTTERIIDEFKTRKYQARLLNVFTDKRGTMRVGGVAVTKDERLITAQCVKCSATMSMPIGIPFATPTREAMELFTYACISHGNNHAAAWFTQRDTYYDLMPASEWQNIKPTYHTTTEQDVNGYDDALNFLYDHKKFCQSTNCEHDHYIDVLMSEVLSGIKEAA